MLPDLATDSFISLFAELADTPALDRRARLAALHDTDSASADRLIALLEAIDRRPAFFEAASIRVIDEAAEANGAVSGGLAPGTVLGDYTIVRRLGAGGMGVVYEARHATLGRAVALKLLSHPWLGDAEVRRFQREARLTARLEHEGIARVYEAGILRTGDLGAPTPFLAMELVDGAPLSAWAGESAAGGRSPREVMEIIRRLALALHYAHERGVLHRDIKPSNILISTSPERERGGSGASPKIIDFGVARALTADAGASLATESGQLVGTLAYMSPEQLEGGSSPIDQRADIYSLGVVAFELLAGRPPIDVRSEPLGRALWRLRHEEPERLIRVRDEPRARARGHRFWVPLVGRLGGRPVSSSSVPPGVPIPSGHPVSSFRVNRDLDAIVTRATARSPILRYPSAASFAADITRWLDGRPVEARAPSAAYTIWRFAARHKRFVAGVLIAGALLTATAAVATIQAIRATRAQDAMLRTIEQTHLALTAGLKDIRGSAEERLAFAEVARSSIEPMLRDMPDNPRVRTTAARTLMAVADVQGNVYSSANLGDVDRAIDNYWKAILLVRPTPDGGSEEAVQIYTEAVFELARCYGDGLRSRECREELLLALDTAIARWSGMEAPPARKRTISMLAFHVVSMHMRAGEPDRASRVVDRIAAVMTDLDTRIDRPEDGPRLGEVWFDYAKAAAIARRFDLAIEAYSKARALFHAYATEPADSLTVADCDRYESAARSRIGDAVGAYSAITRGLVHARTCMKRWPQFGYHRIGLALLLEERGVLGAELGDPSALGDIEEGIAFTRERLTLDPGHAGATGALVRGLMRLGNTYRALHRIGCVNLEGATDPLLAADCAYAQAQEIAVAVLPVSTNHPLMGVLFDLEQDLVECETCGWR